MDPQCFVTESAPKGDVSVDRNKNASLTELTTGLEIGLGLELG